MSFDFRHIFKKVVAVLRSARGHNFLVFLVFLAIAAVLWWVMALSDDQQCDIRMPLDITHVPDSVTIISAPPAVLNASLRAHGSQRLRLMWSKAPTVNLDFRMYKGRDIMRISNTELKALVRSAVDGVDVILVSPDSLSLAYTTSRGVSLPVVVDYSVTAGPKAVLVGNPSASLDSVRVYSVRPLPSSVRSVSTLPVRLNDVVENTTVRVGLVAPPGSRVIPDSVDVNIKVEPLILKSRTVLVEPVNVPAGMRLITFPSRVEVSYMISVSDYKNSEPHMRVIADYDEIEHHNPSRNMRLRLTDVSKKLVNVHLLSDSAEYIIEHL